MLSRHVINDVIVATAVVTVSLLVFTTLHAQRTDADITLAPQFDGDDMMSEIQTEVQVNPLGSKSECKDNPGAQGCEVSSGDDDIMIAVQSRVQVHKDKAKRKIGQNDQKDAQKATEKQTEKVMQKATHKATEKAKVSAEQEKTSGSQHQEQPTKKTDDASSLSSASLPALIEEEISAAADIFEKELSGTSVSEHLASKESKPSHGALLEKIQKMKLHLDSYLEEMTGIKSVSTIAVVLIVLLLICTCVGGLSLAYPHRFPFWGQSEDADLDMLSPAMEQRQLMLERWPPRPDAGAINSTASCAAKPDSPMNKDAFEGRAPLNSNSQMYTSQGQTLKSGLPSLNSLAPEPRGSAILSSQNLQGRNSNLQGRNSIPQDLPHDPSSTMPPPLCPTLVMPACEARFGVPMGELADVGEDGGEVTIVGLSGNPLLRGIVKRVGESRTLEISMLEEGTAPRATITPSMEVLAGHGSAKQSLEIRGMRGQFYGTMEMRSTQEGGACCVMKDGQVVLTVDGDADSLQLTMKSRVGLRCASVRCASEPFGGVDHVEIKVERGMDTVLVLSVTLAVLLLSPYLEPQEG